MPGAGVAGFFDAVEVVAAAFAGAGVGPVAARGVQAADPATAMPLSRPAKAPGRDQHSRRPGQPARPPTATRSHPAGGDGRPHPTRGPDQLQRKRNRRPIAGTVVSIISRRPPRIRSHSVCGRGALDPHSARTGMARPPAHHRSRDAALTAYPTPVRNLSGYRRTDDCAQLRTLHRRQGP